ncbi:FAD-dependent oxidoreductase [Magnetospirillum sp. 15-1]|uniref:NAD(P)/FAD-dependent oxidoreductase n=1 Tax=Magnetospirillum sp. 15-1 TaxID=1979370 RepID=UPI000BBBF116|nr:FAD-dependent oxidoreductase [Magnetospirillum sp. 15-1]
MTDRSLVIVGAAHAGVELAFTARQHGWPGPIVLLGEESEPPYQRPPLSKAYLDGETVADELILRTASAYGEAGIAIRLGIKATRIDRAGRTLELSDGSRQAYDKLALCTGGRPRPLTVEGMVAGKPPANLHYLRTRQDADHIRSKLTAGTRLAIVGGGYIGLEIASTARRLGAIVTLLEAEQRVLARVTGSEMSAFYQRVHQEAGVDIRTGTTAEKIECDDTGIIQAVTVRGGVQIPAELVIVGIGMLPNIELAADAGLTVDGGIIVDELSRTSDPDIVAAGDCTAHDNAAYGRRIRLESVPNALEQARAAALALCGKPKPNRSIPWFWSDQFDLKLQMVGLSAGHEQCVLRGSPADHSFIAFYLRDGRLIAADAVNRQADFLAAKRLVTTAAAIDPTRLADVSIPLKDLLLQNQ